MTLSRRLSLTGSVTSDLISSMMTMMILTLKTERREKGVRKERDREIVKPDSMAMHETSLV